MTVRIVASNPTDGTEAAPLMPGDVELARTSLRCLQGGAEQDPRPAQRFIKPNTATRLLRLRRRLFEAMGDAPESMLPLIEELVRIAEGDVDPEPEAA